MALDIIRAIFPIIANYSVVPIKRHLSYAFNYKSEVEKLQKEVEKLIRRRASLQHAVDNAKRQGEEIEKNVEEWLKNVNKVIDEAGQLVNSNEQAEINCFTGLCPNLKMHYQLGKKAEKYALAISELENEGRIERISYRPALQQIVTTSASGYDTLHSRVSILKEVLDAVGNPNVNMVGVYGLPGVGKTTLMEEVRKQLQVAGNKLFDVVVMATVSEKPDLKRIQGEIGDLLGQTFDEETEVGRALRLRQRLLKEQKVLVILDDIWAKLDLVKVGIPFGDDHRGLKILLTSRNRDVLSNEMGAQKPLELDFLPEREALSLFKKLAGEIKLVEVAKKCAGLPLLIVTVATALKNKDLYAWKDALSQLYRFDNKELQEKVNSTIEFLSYKSLVGDEIKSLFLLCSILGGPYVNIMYLLKCSMGLGLFKHIDKVEVARSRIHKLIDDLKASCLLLNTDINGWVKVHDVVRDIGLSIAYRDQHAFTIKPGVTLNKWPEMDLLKHCTRISLRFFDSPELPERFECPELEFLCLERNNSSLRIPDLFFGGTKKLKVLDLTGISFSSLPQSLGSLTNLCTLCLDQCVLHDVAIIGELKRLEVLSFLESDIVELPREIGQLTRLKLLDLSGCSKLKVIPAKVVSSLSQLEELYMGDGFVEWEVEGNASLAELRHLSHLTALEIHVLDAKILPRDFLFRKLERYKIFIGEMWDWSGKLETSKALKLKLSRSIHCLEYGVKRLVKETEDLYVDEVKGIKNILNDLDAEGFPQLTHLHVQNSHEIQCVIESVNMFPCVAFPTLESLSLQNLKSLEKICHGKLTAGSFSKLSIFIVSNCNRLKNLFSFSVVNSLIQLREMEVSDCINMEEIVIDEHENGSGRNEVAEFTQLCSLRLQRLPQLRRFYSQVKVPAISEAGQNQLKNDPGLMQIVPEGVGVLGAPLPLFNGMIILPRLEDLKISSINVEKIWNASMAKPHPWVQTLTSLTIEGCGDLNHLLRPSMVNNLAQLKKLEICNCKSIKQILVTEAFEEGEMVIKVLFPQLASLKLKGLPKLKSLYTGDLIECPSLKKLWIEKCPDLTTFISSYSSVDVASESSSTLLDDKVVFPNLEELVILHVKRLKMIWHSELHKDSFCKLNSLNVEGAEELLNVFPSNMATVLQNLEYLSITDCGSLEEVFNLQVLANVKPLSFLKLKVVRVSECPNLKSLFPASIAKCLFQLEVLTVKSCGFGEIVARKEGIEAIPRFEFPRLTTLQLWNLRQLERFYPGIHTLEWPMIKILRVFDSQKLEIFASEIQSLQEPYRESQLEIPIPRSPLLSFLKVIPSLEELSLNSKDVAMIRGSKFPADLFNKIKVLNIHFFRDESVTFPLDFVERFHNLEELTIRDTGFKEIFSCKGLISEKNHGTILCQVRKLELFSLHELKHIWAQGSQQDHVLQNLETLEIWFCHGLINLTPPSITTFQYLSALYLYKCNGLKNLVTSSTAKSLLQLRKISVKECGMVAEIVANQGDETKDEIIFCKLTSLELHCLPNLTSFCSANHTLKFPSLKETTVSQCPEMKIFSRGVLIAPKLQRVQVTEEEENGRWEWEGDLNTTIQYVHVEQNEQNAKEN